MKKIITYTACIIFTIPVFAQDKKQPIDTIFIQNKKQPFPFDEFTISANKTTVTNSYAKGLFGFGAGMYHTGLKKYPVNFISGIEYNYTNQFKDAGEYSGHFYYEYDVTYHTSTLSIPFFFRFNLGTKFKFFIETGAYMDFTIAGIVTGLYESDLIVGVDSLGRPHYAAYDSKLKENAGLKFFNGGLSGGAGMSIPLNDKIDLILKSDYRYGIRSLLGDELFNRYFRVVAGIKWNH